MALTSAGTLLEVLTADDGATWTIIVSRPDGLSCVVAAGQNWQDKSNQAGQQPSPSRRPLSLGEHDHGTRQLDDPR